MHWFYKKYTKYDWHITYYCHILLWLNFFVLNTRNIFGFGATAVMLPKVNQISQLRDRMELCAALGEGHVMGDSEAAG